MKAIIKGYKVADIQNPGDYFHSGKIFKNKEDIVKSLASFHNTDFTGCDKNNNKLTIEQFFKYYNINTVQEQLNWLLEWGTWEIEEVI